jgi:Lipopolysaccharide export system permease LptF/LptG
MTEPGARLRSLAARHFDARIMERLIDPVIADLQHEHTTAIRRGRIWRSRKIRFTGYYAALKVIAITTVRHASRGRTATDRRALSRTIAFSLVGVIVLTAVLVWPALSTNPRFGAHTSSWLILYLLPQAIALALPFGLMFGILLGLRDRPTTAHVQRMIAVLAIACAIVAFVNDAWLFPAANQAFRELYAGRPIPRGSNELSLGVLASKAALHLFSGGLRQRLVEFEVHNRVALAFSPFALALFSLGVIAAKRRNRGPITMASAALALSFAYFWMLSWSRAGVRGEWLPPEVAAWGPDFVFLAIGLLLFRRRPSSAGRTLAVRLDRT